MAILKHSLFLVLLLVGFLGASCEPDKSCLIRPSPLLPSSNLSGPAPGYDYFKLALQWPFSYCRKYKQNLCSPPVPPESFTIHGFWPQKVDATTAPACCKTDKKVKDKVLNRLKDKLTTFWPRLESKDDWESSKTILYKPQWESHGSCSSEELDPENYFVKATDLANAHRANILAKLKAERINPGTSHPSKNILNAIEKATKFKADIKCSFDNSGKVQLLEIHLCVIKNGNLLQNCGKSGKAIDCGSQDIIFPSAPPTPPPPSPPSPPPPPSPHPPGFDYFLLSLQWPNALCKEQGITCIPSVPRQSFTIHGLWPQRNNQGSPMNCDTDSQMTDAILEENQCDLLEYWPRIYSADDFDKSRKFWIEEWIKHGTCSSDKFPPRDYVQVTIALGKQNYGPLILSTMKAKGIEPDGSTLRTAKEILDAIKDATNKKALISCSNDRTGKLQLAEIRLCVNKDGKLLEDCKRKSPEGNCKSQFIFASKPSATQTPFSSFVSSIQEVEEANEL